MRRWEYMQVTVALSGDQWRPQYIQGQEVDNWKHTQSIYWWFWKWGLEGWELVTYVPTFTEGTSFFAKVIYIHAVFKRPVE